MVYASEASFTNERAKRNQVAKQNYATNKVSKAILAKKQNKARKQASKQAHLVVKEWREEGRIFKVALNQLIISYFIAKYLYFNKF